MRVLPMCPRPVISPEAQGGEQRHQWMWFGTEQGLGSGERSVWRIGWP